MRDAQAFIDRELDRFREELFEFLRIPSVSARTEHRNDVRRAAAWLADRMTAAGLRTEVIDTPGHPVVLGEWRSAGPDAPTILVYGHYDVQPSDPDHLWESPAFEPEVREGRIYARGSADDKGQLYQHVKAIEAQLADGGALPVNVVVLAEGEEEIGSPNLVPFVRKHRERLAADAVVVSDSAMFAPGLPSLLFSLRGLAYFEVTARAASGDLHSGAYGGAVANPANAMARLIASLHDGDGRIAIEGFYDDVLAWEDEVRAGIRSLPFDEPEFMNDVGTHELTGEQGFSTLERLWIRPTCDVNGMISGYTGEGAKTVLPAVASAKISFRLVPDQDPDRVGTLFRAHVAAHTPAGVSFEVEDLHGGRPWRGQAGGRVFKATERALEESFGTRPVHVGEGGSIPIVVEFEEILKAPAILVGFALPGANMHAPNEWFPLENYEKGIRALAHLYDELAAS